MSNTVYGFINLADGGGLKLGSQDGSDNVVCQVSTTSDTVTFSNTKNANPTYLVLNSAFYTTFGKTPSETASRVTIKGNDATHGLRIIDDDTTNYFDFYKSANAIVLASNTPADQFTINNRLLLTPGASVTGTHFQITFDGVLAASAKGLYLLSNVVQTNAIDMLRITTSTTSSSSTSINLNHTGADGQGIKIARSGVTTSSSSGSALYIDHDTNNASTSTAIYIDTANAGTGGIAVTAAFEFNGDCITASAVSTPATTTGYFRIKDGSGVERKVYYYP